jgi:hypothetical protein
MVKIGIIYNEIFSEEIKTIYRYLTNLNFNVYVISSKHILLDIPNKILKDIEKCKDELYIDKINVYLNFDEKKYDIPNFTIYSLTSLPIFKETTVLQFNNKYNLEYDSEKIVNSDEFLRELLINNSSINVVEYKNTGYIFKNNRVTDIIANKKQLTNLKYKSEINVNIYCNWNISSEVIPAFKKFCQYYDKNVYTWNFKHYKLNLTCNLENPDYNYIMNATNNALTNNSIYFCMEPPNTFENYYNICKNNNITFYGSHKYHQNMIDWHVSKTVDELSTMSFTKVYNNVLSVIVSDYYRDPGHKLRLDFIRELDNRAKENKLPFELHIYGRCKSLNFHCFKKELTNGKDDGLLSYKYHFNAENISSNNYVTEKFTDAIVSECLIFYWGCPNLEKLYDDKSFVRLTLLKENYDKEIELIYNCMNNNEFDKRLTNIINVKQDIIYNRSPFVRINNVINLSNTDVYLVKKLQEEEIINLKNSCFKTVIGINFKENVIEAKINLMQHILTNTNNCLLLNKEMEYSEAYNKLSLICLDTYDIVFLTNTTGDIFSENVWIKISILEEIYMYILQLYQQTSSRQLFENSFTENLKTLLKMKKYQIKYIN